MSIIMWKSSGRGVTQMITFLAETLNPKRDMVIQNWTESERYERMNVAMCGDFNTHLTLTGHAGQLLAKHPQMEGK